MAKKDLAKILKILNDCFTSKSAACIITKMTDQITTKCKYMRADISVHIDHVAATIGQLKGMNVIIEVSVCVESLVASTKAMSLCLATIAIKTLAENNLKWETVLEFFTKRVRRLMDRKSIGSEISPAVISKDGCGISVRKGRTTATCFLKLLYAHNRLGFSKDKKKDIEDRSRSSSNRFQKGNSGWWKMKRDKERNAMPCPQK